MSSATEKQKTGVGSYFVSNYPPFSQWKPENVPDALEVLNRDPRPDDPMGLYIHIPFCRKRCEFCYFKVYTDKNAEQIESYLSALDREMELYSQMPALRGGRKLRFMYFGGGTPSYLSEKQLSRLVQGLDRHISWSDAEEVTFECEPGTLRKSKLQAIRDMGVTRLSLGVENFDDKILEANGRAHLSPEIYRAYEWAREVDFPQLNIDLIAGMVGESEKSWRISVAKALELEPDSITVYQMELPYNTIISKRILNEGAESPIPDWETKRRWVNYAMEQFEGRGYEVASATTIVSKKKNCKFVYTDSLWRGTDMIGIGVSSFGHFDGVHIQNAPSFAPHIELVESGKLPIQRALRLTPTQLLIREMILQLKTGHLDIGYFKNKFGRDISVDFGEVYDRLIETRLAERNNGSYDLTRDGLLRVDSFLRDFFEPEFREVRYT